MLKGPQSQSCKQGKFRNIYRLGRGNAGSDLPERVLDFACFPKIVMHSATLHSQLCPFSQDKPCSHILKSRQRALNC